MFAKLRLVEDDWGINSSSNLILYIPDIKVEFKNKLCYTQHILFRAKSTAERGVPMTFEQCKKKLETYHQEHVLKYYDDLTEVQKEALLTQIENTDFSMLKSFDGGGKQQRGVISPLAAMEIPEIEKNRKAFMKEGLEALKSRKIGAVLLAGGMGTRLGSEKPKGMYNIGITKEVYIFERLIANLLEVVEQAGNFVPLFIMTSDKNHEETVAFLQEKRFFGYDRDSVWFFKQDMAPASDYEGRIYMEEKWKMSVSPNGNGGWYTSMRNAGLLEVVEELKLEWLNVFSVDNVLQRIADPCFVGATIMSGCDVSSKVVKKTNPEERVGVMCLEDGRPSVVEYYEVTEEMRQAKDAKGEPAYNFGVTLNYLFRKEAIDKVAEDRLPLHIVEKKIPYMNEAGEYVKPEEPNGLKYEQLVLDMVHELNQCLPYEVVREKEFAPIKNKTGVDSVDTARELLKQNGIQL